MDVLPRVELAREELAVFLKNCVGSARDGGYTAFHAAEDRLLVVVPTRRAGARKRRTPFVTTAIFIIPLLSAVFALLTPGGPQPMVLVLGLAVTAAIFLVTRYWRGRTSLDVYGFVRDIGVDEAKETLQHVERTHEVHLPFIQCQRWYWDIERMEDLHEIR